MNGSKKITWEAYDHIREEKTSDWYWVIGILAVAIAVVSIFFDNILFALLIIIGTFVIFLSSHHAPKIVEYEINRKGVRVGEIIYTYATLESFYVIDEDGFDRDRIILKSRKTFMPFIIIPLGSEVIPDEIRDYLLEYLNEEEMTEPVIQKVLTHLGF